MIKRFTPEYHEGLLSRIAETFSVENGPLGLDPVYKAADGAIEVGLAEPYILTDGQPRQLSSRHEYGIMAVLAVRAGTGIHIARIAYAAWGYGDKSAQQIARVRIGHIRSWLGPDLGGAKGGVIETLPGKEYRLVE